MSHPGTYLRTPDANPGSFVKVLWDFTRNILDSSHPPQYELFKLRITSDSSKYWAVVHVPSADPNQGPPYVVFIERSMPTVGMAIEAAAYEAITRLRFIVPTAIKRGSYYFPSRAASGVDATFCCERRERDPALANLIQYVMAQERLTQQMMDYLSYLTFLNPQIAIGGPPLPTSEGHVLRLLPPLSPGEEEGAPAPMTFPQDPVDLTIEP
jgi:hypothetical protein